MNKLYYILSLIIIFTYSCSQEDSLKPSNLQEDYFSVAENATDPISVLRRDFHKRTNVHLLFNDTLCQEIKEIDKNGNPIWYIETIDFNYFITNTTDKKYSFEYMTIYDEMKEASLAIEELILPYFKHEALPYSVLLTKQCLSYNSYYNKYKPINYINGLRCLALSWGNYLLLPEAEKSKFCTDLVYGIVYDALKGLSSKDQTLNPFYSHCENLYRRFFQDPDLQLPSGMDPYNLTKKNMHTLGFLQGPSPYFPVFPSQEEDWSDYLHEIFYTEENVFRTKYANYPIIITKYETLKQIISTMGYNI